MRASRLAWLCFSLTGCLFDCGPSTPEPETSCVEDEPAPADSHAVVIGSAEGDSDFAKLSDGAELQLDYGSQGGQHFYYSLRLFGATAAQTLVVTFTPSDFQQDGQGGGSASGAGGAGGGGGAGGSESECCESSLPSDVVALSEYAAENCESGWLEIDNLLLQVYNGSPSGTLRVELGSCDGSCQVSEQGVYVLSKVDAASEIQLTYNP